MDNDYKYDEKKLNNNDSSYWLYKLNNSDYRAKELFKLSELNVIPLSE